MKNINAGFLRTALVAIFLTTFGAGFAQAQYGGGSWGGGSGNCSGGTSGSYSREFNIVGLTSDQRLVCFDEFNPGSAITLATVSGLITDTNLVGVDFRPATGFNADGSNDGGDLYGLGNAGGVYVIDLRSG